MPSINPYKDLTIKATWDTNLNSMVPENLTALMRNSNTTHSTLAFIVAEDGSCKPAWGGYKDYSVENKWGKYSIQEFIKNGGTATISFGGANGIPLESACPNVPTLVSAITSVISTYDIKKLDFDIEGANLSNQQNIKNLATAISQIQQHDSEVQVSVTLPVLPTGLTFEGLNIVNVFKDHNINFCVNIMAMDYGQGVAPDTHKMADYTISAIDATHAQLKTIYPEKSTDFIWQNMLALTPMIGVNDVWNYPENKPEFFSLDDANKISHYAALKKFEIRYWSIDRDLPCDQKYATAICSGEAEDKKAQNQPYDYARAFKGGLALSLLLGNQLINITNTINETSANSNNDKSTDSNMLLTAQIVCGTGLLLATMGAGALLTKKYGHHVVEKAKSMFSFWNNRPASSRLQDEENALHPELSKGYSTFAQ